MPRTRLKNTHLKRRKNVWWLRKRIPKDIREIMGYRGAHVEKTLSTTDVKEARRKRDALLRQLEGEWEAARRTGLDPREESLEQIALRMIREDDTGEREAALEGLSVLFDQLRDKKYRELRQERGSDPELYDEAGDLALESPEGERLVRARDIMRGTRTPIEPVAKDWLAMKTRRLTKASIRDYTTAINALTNRFSAFEEISRKSARSFLSDLLETRARPTVNKYLIAFRGLADHVDRDASVWKLKGLESGVPSAAREPWTDEDLKALIKGCRDERIKMAMLIGAYTGARLSGIASLSVEEAEGGLVLDLPETKTKNSARKIPCHSKIEETVRKWEQEQRDNKLSAFEISKRFGRLKKKLKFPKSKVFHSFRHSVTGKLENAQVSPLLIKRIRGDKMSGDIAFGIYSQGVTVETMRPAMEKISWDL